MGFQKRQEEPIEEEILDLNPEGEMEAYGDFEPYDEEELREVDVSYGEISAEEMELYAEEAPPEEEAPSGEELFPEEIIYVELPSEEPIPETERDGMPEELHLEELGTEEEDASPRKKGDARRRRRFIFRAAAAVAALLLVCVAASVYVRMRPKGSEVPEGLAVSDAAEALRGIEVIGQQGLLAALDGSRAAAALRAEELARQREEEARTEAYTEADYAGSVQVSMETLSVLKDLKIKFTNTATRKLIGNVPFTLTVTTPDGRTVSWTDDDQDGVIYYKNLAEGTYTLHAETLSGEKYAEYRMPLDHSVEVKGEIAYIQVEVADEVKSASQVNEAAEDTTQGGNAGAEETSPGGGAEEEHAGAVDTVEWVERSSTPTYVEVKKADIPVPEALKAAEAERRVVFVVAISPDVSGNDAGPDPDEGGQEASGEEAPEREENGTGEDREGTPEEETGEDPEGEAENGSDNGTGQNREEEAADEEPEKLDMTTALVSADGDELLVLEDGAYRAATYEDYARYDVFYQRGETRYTGWWNLEGSTYFFDKNCSKVTGDQIIQGISYTFSEEGVLQAGSGTLGIDVSKWNGKIDWISVREAGVSYAVIRVGYRGSTQGALIDDAMFEENIKGALAAGLKVGVYFVTQAVDEVEAVYEASMVIDRISGYRISLPVFLDVEASGGRGDKIDAGTRTAVCRTFCETIQSAGYTAGIYANKNWLTTKMDASKLESYKIWLAHYTSQSDYGGRYDLWQYTENGQIDGISGKVDLNRNFSLF